MILLLTSAALASPVHVDLSARSVLPISVGAQVAVELPLRLRASLGVGVLPGSYVHIINGVATSAGWYDDATASLISAALKSSLLIHPQIGWRPAPRLGFHFDLGYANASLGGSLSAAETVAAVSGLPVPSAAGVSAIELDARAVDHLLTVDLGWQIVAHDHLVVDLTLGGAFSVAAHSTLTPSSDVAPRLAARFNQQLGAFTSAGEAALDDTLTSYVHTPTLGLSLGYRFR